MDRAGGAGALTYARLVTDLENPTLTMYSTTWCGYCRRLKTQLDAQGIAYREVVRIPLERGKGTATIVVHRGSEPTRVALRVGQPTEFTTEDPDSAPHAMQDTLSWADTPPAGSHAAKEKARKADRSRVRFAWGGLAITLVALVIAAWWIARGWFAARRRGVERAAEERRSSND